jgi:hypothetical protein
MLKKFTVGEIKSVIAHEMGHYKAHHLWKGLTTRACLTLLTLFIGALDFLFVQGRLSGIEMKKWYVVHTQTGSEDKVKKSLEGRIASSDLKELMGQILIPTEQVSEVRSGKKKITQRKFFPGYILVEIETVAEVAALARVADVVGMTLASTTAGANIDCSTSRISQREGVDR